MKGKEILRGATASGGIVVGYVRIIDDASKEKLIDTSDILVLDVFHYDEYWERLRKAGGLIENKGGLTSYGAVACRELGIPCINGTAYRGTPATEALKEGSLIILESFTDYERDEHGDIVHKKDGSPKPFGTAFQYLPDEPGAAPLTAKAHYLPSKSRFCGLNIKEFLVQYGYRDIVDFLEAHGYKPETTARK